MRIRKHDKIFSDKPGSAKIESHTIPLTPNVPIVSRPYKVPFNQRPELSKELMEMEKLGIVRNSQYGSPIVIVQKKDHTIRICPDYRKLNKVSVFDP